VKWQTLFDPENSFWVFMGKITDVVFLSLCWLLFSLPVITAGAATVALFQFTLKQAEDSEGYAFRSFCRAFTQNFGQSTFLWLLYLVGCAFFIFDFYALFFYKMPVLIHICAFAIAACLAFLFEVMFCYAFPVLARFNVSAVKALKDGLIMAFQHPGRTLLILCVYAVMFWASYMRPVFSPVFLALALFCVSYLLRRLFRNLTV